MSGLTYRPLTLDDAPQIARLLNIRDKEMFGQSNWWELTVSENLEGVGFDLSAEPERSGARPLALLPWRDAAAEYAVSSRALAEAVTGLLELRGHGPLQVRERMPVALLGVHAPGLMLECGVLSAPEDRERLASPEGLARLASLIADGVLAWARDG